eukprot:86505-Rhodomonas_salina.3
MPGTHVAYHGSILRAFYAMSGTHIVYDGSTLQTCYTMPGTHVAYYGSTLRACYAMSGTDGVLNTRCPALATRCPVLTEGCGTRRGGVLATLRRFDDNGNGRLERGEFLRALRDGLGMKDLSDEEALGQ